MTEVISSQDEPAGATAQAGPKANEPFLVVENLSVKFPTYDGIVNAVTDLSYTVDLGETLGIVGESGSGKSVSSMAVLGLHDEKRSRLTGSIRVGGKEIVGAPDSVMRKVRGADVSMIFQDPLTALHPFFTVGAQIIEGYRLHHDVTKKAAKDRAIDMLGRVGIPEPRRRVDDYPHQFSGGMRQRAMIAMSLVNDPKVLIADEPTTALDVTVQAQILDLIQNLQQEFGSAVVIITHDLGVIAEIADNVLVMYAGRCVEAGTCKQLLTHPEMPYTWGLLGSIADVTGDPNLPLVPIPGTPPSLLNPPTGCSFHPRCTHQDKATGGPARCRTELPLLRPNLSPDHLMRCHIANPDAVYESEVKEAVLG